MNSMVNEVLEYSRIGRLELKPIAVDISKIITEHIKDLILVYNADHVKVNLGEMPIVQGDPMMLSQVFANLLSNAIKYSLPSANPEVFIDGVANEFEIVYSIR